MTTESLDEQIELVRRMALAGRDAPLIGGRICLLAGVLFAAASLFTWLVLDHYVAASLTAIGVAWAAALAVVMAYLLYLRQRFPEPNADTTTNRAARAAWSGIGRALFALQAAFLVVALRSDDSGIYLLLPSCIFALYGAAWTVGAAMTERIWLKVLALASFAAAIALALAERAALSFLLQAFAFLILVAAPGAVLLRLEKAAAR